jgi:EmrB/QacA subfamily drug resistance transporter
MTAARTRPCEAAAIRSARGAACTVAQQRWVLAATILASTIAYVDESVVNVALPAIGRDLAASPAALQWVINAYTLCLAAFLLVGGAAGDRLGRRRVFIAGVMLFGAASLGCGLAHDTAQLIGARAVQGAGAALLIPCSLALIGAAFSDGERGRAIGTWAGFSAIAAAIAAAIGPLLGGWIVDHLAWQAIFFINPFLCLAALWIAWRHLPESVDPEASAGIDWPGALLAFVGLAGVAFGLIALPDTGLLDATTAATLLVGAVLLSVFVWHEARSPAPMMPLGLFRSAAFSGVNALTFLLYGALGGALFLLPFALISVHGYSATMAGAVFLPFTAIMAVLSRWSGGLLDRFGARLPLVTGPAIVAVGFVLFALAGPDTSYALAFLLPVSIVGLGMAVTVAPLTTTVIAAVPGHQTGVASGINNAVSSVASLFAIAAFGALALHGSLAEGIRLAMLVAAALALAASACAALTIRGPGLKTAGGAPDR